MGGKRWTSLEDSVVRSMNSEGKKYKEISSYLEGRSYIACQIRGQFLGLDGLNNNADVNFFNNDSREMYYVLGYWYADGSIFYKSGGTYFDISSIDREQLEKIRSIMGIKTAISESKTVNSNMFYSLRVGNTKLVNNLISRFDVMYQKTDKITIDENKIPAEFFYDFLRGYFDGDGSLVFSSRLKNNGEQPLNGIKFTGSKNIIFSLHKILEKVYKCTLYEDKRQSKNSCWYLGIYGESSRKILKSIYENPTIYLDRKYEKYLNTIRLKTI